MRLLGLPVEAVFRSLCLPFPCLWWPWVRTRPRVRVAMTPWSTTRPTAPTSLRLTSRKLTPLRPTRRKWKRRMRRGGGNRQSLAASLRGGGRARHCPSASAGHRSWQAELRLSRPSVGQPRRAPPTGRPSWVANTRRTRRALTLEPLLRRRAFIPFATEFAACEAARAETRG